MIWVLAAAKAMSEKCSCKLQSQRSQSFHLCEDEAFQGYITLPPDLTRDERAFLHRIAEEQLGPHSHRRLLIPSWSVARVTGDKPRLDLSHESVGEGSERALRIWRADTPSG